MVDIKNYFFNMSGNKETATSPTVITYDEVLNSLADLLQTFPEDEFHESSVEAAIMKHSQVILSSLREQGIEILPENVEVIFVNETNFVTTFSKKMQLITHPKEFGDFTIQLQLDLEGREGRSPRPNRRTLLLNLLKIIGYSYTDIRSNKLLILVSKKGW